MSGTRPGVGDLVVAVAAGTKWVCTDIAGAKTRRPVWVLRPLYGAPGGETVRVEQDAIASYSVVSRRGEWSRS
ncbi:hypothetical protein MUU72_26960 [Streptomyces sp. RS10V-4]|uniref:hypothetical protein n=1 Tax=Streptomyces rhizoryzae TaxID=2932493 RepID=UPI002002AD3E|nr:hypothetical protein [Streptomyces rhizoryzae]MCK7626700.1 hypothetical protein [Streptomyces rhizoryzae]